MVSLKIFENIESAIVGGPRIRKCTPRMEGESLRKVYPQSRCRSRSKCGRITRWKLFRRANMQALRSCQLPTKTLRNFLQITTMANMELAGEPFPSKLFWHLLALRLPCSLCSGPSADERRWYSSTGLGCGCFGVNSQEETDIQQFHQPHPSHHTKFFW